MGFSSLSSSASSSSSSASSSSTDGTLTLIPGLPNDLSALILAHVPYSHHPRLRSTCRSWRALLSSVILALRRRLLPPARLSQLLCLFPQDPFISPPFIFDPRASAWGPLPPLPCNPHVYGLCNFAALALGPHLYVIGGSLFDTRSFPLDRPSPSSAAFRLDLTRSSPSWDRLAPMLTPRGSFAYAADPDLGQILVAGGGSRHTVFGAAGSRMSSVERYDVGRDEWVALDGLPRFRAGCTGFVIGNVEEREFWVMGGYGESRTVSGMFPVDEYYRDAVVMELKSGGKWRGVGDMWEDGERRRFGKIVVADDEVEGVPGVFMLDGSDIFRYDMASNFWQKESSVPRKAPNDSEFGFVAVDGQLHVMTLLNGVHSTETRRSRLQKSSVTLFIQIYHPGKKTWKSLMTKPPFHYPLDFKSVVLCTIGL